MLCIIFLNIIILALIMYQALKTKINTNKDMSYFVGTPQLTFLCFFSFLTGVFVNICDMQII